MRSAVEMASRAHRRRRAVAIPSLFFAACHLSVDASAEGPPVSGLASRVDAALREAAAALDREEARLDELAAQNAGRTLADGRPSLGQAAAYVRLLNRRIRELDARNGELREELNVLLASLGSDIAAMARRLSAPQASPAPQRNPEPVEAELDHGRADRRAVQAGHASLGFDPGPVDGLFGARQPSAPRERASPAPQRNSEAVEAELDLGRADRCAVQAGLASLGFDPGPVDGLFGRKTRGALAAWQSAKGQAATGWLTAAEARVLQAAGGEELQARAEAERQSRPIAIFPPLREQRAAVRPGTVFQDCNVCPKMVVVPAGSFTMGSPPSEEGRRDNESPQRRVTIPEPFAVGKYEVTFREWDRFTAAGGCARNPSDKGWGRGNRPVIFVTWDDAQAYVHWLSQQSGKWYRLLSEAEWEYAARAGSQTRYAWGDEIGRNRANCNGCGSRWERKTVPVGSFSANGFGLHDMSGNVSELVEDCEHDGYTGAPSDGKAWTVGGDCSRRVERGGSWMGSPNQVRSADRRSSPTTGQGSRFTTTGFRVARTLAP